MDRLEMLKKAVQFAHEQVDGSAALNDVRFEELKNKNEEDAVTELAKDILEEAVFNTESPV